MNDNGCNCGGSRKSEVVAIPVPDTVYVLVPNTQTIWNDEEDDDKGLWLNARTTLDEAMSSASVSTRIVQYVRADARIGRVVKTMEFEG